ncbi:MAG: hypothetical protein AAF291_01020 [Pseudomonadota bacterium]
MADGEKLVQRSRATGEWNVMILSRERGETYLLGNNITGTQTAYGFIEKIDPVSLEPLVRSPNLSPGGHTWCGGAVIHENGDIYVGVGDRLHRLNADCDHLAEAILPRPRAYNGVMILGDGTLITKNMEIEADKVSTISLLNPDTLAAISPPIDMPEASMGRFAIDTQGTEQHVYIPGVSTVYRYIYKGGALKRDPSWEYKYRESDDRAHSAAWDVVISGGYCWFQDNGCNQALQHIMATSPIGASVPPRGTSWRGTADGPVHLHRVSLDDCSDAIAFAPFDLPGGSIISPPVHDPVRDIAVAFDSVNGHVGGFRIAEDGAVSKLWVKPARTSMQMCLFPDTAELAINDFQDGQDCVVLLDIETGRELGRAVTESRFANGMILSAGQNRDVYYCSIGFIARAWIE